MTHTLDQHLTNDLSTRAAQLLRGLGTEPPAAGALPARTPITGGQLVTLRADSLDAVDAAIGRAAEAFRSWRTVPAPVRAAVVRRLAELLTEHKSGLGELVTLEAGKIGAE